MMQAMVEALNSGAGGPGASSWRFGYMTTPTPGAGALGTVVDVTEVRPLPTGTYLVAGRGGSRFRVVDHWVDESVGGLNYARVQDAADEDVREVSSLLHDAAAHLYVRAEAAHERMMMVDAKPQAGNDAGRPRPHTPSASMSLSSSSSSFSTSSFSSVGAGSGGIPSPTASSSFSSGSPVSSSALGAAEGTDDAWPDVSGVAEKGLSAAVRALHFTPTDIAAAAGELLVADRRAYDAALRGDEEAAAAVVARHRALCALRAYAIARVMAQHLCMALASSAQTSVRAQFRQQYGAAPTSFLLDGPSGRADGETVSRLSYWLASVIPLAPAQRSVLHDAATCYARLWACIAALWPAHGFGHLSLDTVSAFVHRGTASGEVVVALTNAERKLFPEASSPPSAAIGAGSQQCYMTNMWRWLQTALRHEGAGSGPGAGVSAGPADGGLGQPGEASEAAAATEHTVDDVHAEFLAALEASSV
jgi:hypothetical protein